MDPLASTVNQFSISLVAITVLISLYAFKLLFLSKRKHNFPPIAGTIFHQLLNFHRLTEYQTDLSRKYKTFRTLAPFNNYVFTVDPVNVEYILKTNFANYGKGPFLHNMMKDLLGDGIFLVDGDKWRQQRKIASFEFSTKMLRDYTSEIFQETAHKLAKRVSELASSNQRIDIQNLFMKSTMDSIFKVGFGVDLGTLSDVEESIAFSKAFDEASAQTLYRAFDIMWPIKRFLNIGAEARMKRDIKLIDDFVNNVIEKKIKHMSTQNGEFMKKEDILSRFLIEREKAPSVITDKYLRDVILNFVIAGRDTTAGTLSWLFYLISKHPDVQEKIAREVREATKMAVSNVEIKELVSCLNDEKLNNMQYLHASLNETLRLYPAVPMNPKFCRSDDILPDGFEIKKGDSVDYQPFSMGRMKFLWGDDAEEFKPERWLDEDGHFVPQSPFKFTAFQAGPRICLGKEFAYRQMKIFVATSLFFFKFQMWDDSDTHEVKMRTMLTLQIDGGLHLRVMHRK